MKLARRQPIVAKAEINNGQINVPSVLLDVVSVTKENMLETVVKDGFHTAEEVGAK